MESNNTWKTVSENEYELWDKGIRLVQMTLVPQTASSDARVETAEGKWFIRREGFWKTRVVVEDVEGQVWATLSPKAWYSSQWNLIGASGTDSLVLRNNPLAEYAILRDGDVLLAYGLGAGEGTPHLRVTQPNADTPILLHALLWYLFLPIAKENIANSDNLIFLLMSM
jgi:hypothetical protein